MKPVRHKPYGLLQPLPIPERPWGSISMDFITDLPKSGKFDSILVVADRLTKMSHFIACKKSTSAMETANLLIDNVFRFHGLPDDIISDRGPQFTSKFWKSINDIFGIKVKLSTAFHPESDGQTERINQVLEQYLRGYVNYLQDDWPEKLSLAEFSYNNSCHSSTGKSPFFSNYGFHPKFDIGKPEFVISPGAENLVTRLTTIQSELKLQLAKAQESYKKFADKRRSDCKFKIGDSVWLLRKNIRTTRPCNKLDFKRLGPFKITNQINPVTFTLDLPASFKIHNNFHASLLEPVIESKMFSREKVIPTPVIIDDQIEYEVESILDSKYYNGKLYYLVNWFGYGINDQSWEPASNLKNSQVLVKAFHEKYSQKPRPRGRPKRRVM